MERKREEKGREKSMIQNPNVKLYNQDCLEVLDKFIEKGRKVGAIVTSPPYNMCMRIQNGKFVSRWAGSGETNRGHLTNKYSNYKDDMPIDKYEEFQTKFLEKSLQVSDYVFYNIQMVTGNKIPLLHIMGKFAEKIKDIIIWDKMVSQPAMNEGVLNSTWEFLIILSNSEPLKRTFAQHYFERGKEDNIWHIKRKRNKYIKAGFPEELIERIINDFVGSGKIVMDPFMGSGTTGVVAQRMGCKFVGCELDPEMFKIAEERINNI